MLSLTRTLPKGRARPFTDGGYHRLGGLRMSLKGLLLAFAATVVQANEWEPVTGTEALSEFMSGAIAERELPNGSLSRGEYFADGTGILSAWGETFPRTWSVQADQMCISEVRSTRCYRLERSTTDRQFYRVIDVASGETTEFRLTDGRADLIRSDEPPGDSGTAATISAEEMANKLANPTAAVATMGNNLVYNRFGGEAPGADDENGFTYLFQPVLPFPQRNGNNILLRPAIPLIFRAPVPDPQGGFRSSGVELGDIGFDLVYGGTSANGLMTSVGIAGLIPTATDDAIGADQWRLGPEVLLGVARKWGAVGAIVNHQWDIAGSNDDSTSITAGQYFYAINLGGGLQFASGPSFSYDHKAESGQKLTLPLGVGLGKTVILNGRPWKFQIQYWNYVERPDLFGPKHQLRLTISPVVQVPWGR